METQRPSTGDSSGCVLACLLRRPALFRAFVLACALLAAPLQAPLQAAEEEDEIRGFIVDNSISHIGHEFYRYFSERLRDTSRLDFNLVVRERPSARWGSLVWVEYEGRTLYRRFLAPNVSEVQPVAYEAADLIQEAVTRQKLESLLQDTYDLDKDEL